MPKKIVNNIKLGVFVIAGLAFLILLLYMIGRNKSMFGNNYVLKARFDHVQGLVAGNNVRYSGISAGTVKNVKIISDTVIEVTMTIERKMKKFIRKNAVVSISTDGFVGNKIVNITPAREAAPLAEEGDILVTKKLVSTDDMLQVLERTNRNVAFITDSLRLTVGGINTIIQRVNNSEALWGLLNDQAIPAHMRAATADIRKAAANASQLTGTINQLVTDIKNGKGSVGAVLTDSSYAVNLDLAIQKIKTVAGKAEQLAGDLDKLVRQVDQEINNGNGTLHALLKDSAIVQKLNSSLDNIRKGTDGFNQNMEALKHSFLFRGYFRKLEKRKQQ